MKKEYTNTNSNDWDMDTSQPVDREELNRRLEAVKKRIDEQIRMHMFRKYGQKRPNKKTNSSKGW